MPRSSPVLLSSCEVPQGTVSEAIMPPSKVLSSWAFSTIAEV